MKRKQERKKGKQREQKKEKAIRKGDGGSKGKTGRVGELACLDPGGESNCDHQLTHVSLSGELFNMQTNEQPVCSTCLMGVIASV